jgi:uncharacterized protein YyaL (SSP411 family)
MRFFHPAPLLIVSGIAAALAPVPSRAAEAASASPVSAFVREQSAGAVKWLPWGEAAFARAKAENKPIYLHVGLFTSELSRAMARQSFSNADTAKFLNENFVCILVDRDEQPDVAALYRAYLHTVKQMDGWPLNVWLTPELRPFEGATYLPPSEEWGKPGLTNVTKQVAGAWASDAAAQRQKASDAVAALQAAEKSGKAPTLDAAALAKIVAENTDAWKGKYDATNGGFGDPPKRLEPELLQFLLRDAANREMALTTLKAMADGAVRDPLDGGFFRQATDASWKQPYFQKTLGDQTRLALAYLDAARLDPDPRLPAAARGALTYALQTLGRNDGGFAAAEDASGDTLGYYLWTLAELKQVLGDKDGAAFAKAMNVAEAGNIPEDAYPGATTVGKNILFRAGAEPLDPAVEARLAGKLLDARRQRPAPRRDPSATAGAHGLMLTALSRAADELKEPKFRAAADRTFACFRDQFHAADGLRRIAGRPSPAAPEDYLLVLQGLRAYAAVSHVADADKIAAELSRSVKSTFEDTAAGRYFAVPANAGPGIWSRIHVPAPGAGELPAPEAIAVLLAAGEKDRDPFVTSAISALGVEARDSTEAARGDLLLALRAASAAR